MRRSVATLVRDYGSDASMVMFLLDFRCSVLRLVSGITLATMTSADFCLIIPIVAYRDATSILFCGAIVVSCIPEGSHSSIANE